MASLPRSLAAVCVATVHGSDWSWPRASQRHSSHTPDQVLHCCKRVEALVAVDDTCSCAPRTYIGNPAHACSRAWSRTASMTRSERGPCLMMRTTISPWCSSARRSEQWCPAQSAHTWTRSPGRCRVVHTVVVPLNTAPSIACRCCDGWSQSASVCVRVQAQLRHVHPRAQACRSDVYKVSTLDPACQ
jgi:hypothetical protein